jgi:hypothetical protein
MREERYFETPYDTWKEASKNIGKVFRDSSVKGRRPIH